MRMAFLNKEKEDAPVLSAYVKSLNQQIDDASRMKSLVESPGWKIVQKLWKEFEDRSQVAFLSGEITSDEHKAQIKAIRIIVGGVEAIAGKTNLDSDPKVKLSELEIAIPPMFRRY